MPRFFFDLADDGEIHPDTEGVDLPTLESVENEATRALLEIVKDQKSHGFREVAFRVRDQASQLFVVKVTFELSREVRDG
ncbi:hypothetical protein LB577_19405 [Mesorhizobium sp. B283B1A]|uniref:DUF6894 family protein n=1 Tax=Mesorhizobium TaxID=68287 RepID=UPI0012135A73|nr:MULTISPECIES: hypothetical protein [Mesorhizobium]MCA0049089.1 hypothetical protein [Mesorhizobium sp. B283B1A]TJV06491.1 MAG: hypothetical protein E5Y12_04730 [Mesorhizobium sp.]UQS62720.1 hypothetical protein M5D98_21495 [Mesorhizobium opportunistum]